VTDRGRVLFPVEVFALFTTVFCWLGILSNDTFQRSEVGRSVSVICLLPSFMLRDDLLSCPSYIVSTMFFWVCRRRQYVPPKRWWPPTTQYGVTAQKTNIDIFTYLLAMNFTYLIWRLEQWNKLQNKTRNKLTFCSCCMIRPMQWNSQNCWHTSLIIKVVWATRPNCAAGSDSRTGMSLRYHRQLNIKRRPIPNPLPWDKVGWSMSDISLLTNRSLFSRISS
jgi:hypothetical protein